MSVFSIAANDWIKSTRMASLWSNLAIEDLRDRYRRTVFGLLWVVLSFALFVVVKITIFGQLSNVSAAEFGLFVSLGFGLWSYISSVVLDSCTAYVHARSWILGTATPYPVFLLQAIYRNWLIFGLIMLVMAGALFWKATPWEPAMLSALPALLAYMVTSIWLAAALAPLCVRYRDLHHAVQTLMRLAFFATPILWMPQSNGRLAAIAQWNPIAHFIDIVRDPLMYNSVPWDSWAVVLAINLLGIPLAMLVYVRTRPNIIFWV